MNKNYLLLFLFCSSLLTAQNSKFNSKIPSITRGDLEATIYPPDTTANAFYIFEEGFSQIDRTKDYNIVTRYSAKLKILNKKGFDEANIEIPLGKTDKKKETLSNLKAYTYNLENGKITKQTVADNQVFTEELENYDLAKFTFPNVRPGSVLIYSYEIESPFIFKFNTWRFQDYIPKAYSKFTAKIPANYEYYTTLRGGMKLVTDTSTVVKRCISFGNASTQADCVKSVYAMEDIPAFKSENFMTAEKNYIGRIEYELKQIVHLDGYKAKYTKEWEDVDKELKTHGSIGRQLKKDRLVEDLLPESISSMDNNLEKAKKIYRFVQEEFNWNQKFDIFDDMKIRNVLEERTGNVMEINAILHNLFISEGFEVLPVMAATRNKGFPTRVHPVLSDFNYFFIQLNLDKEQFYLDATEKNLDFGRLPYRALNEYARLMDFDKGSSWIDIIPDTYSSQFFRDSIKVHPDGTSTGYSKQVFNGYNALSLRNKIQDLANGEIFRKATKPAPTTNSEKVEVENENDPDNNLEFKFSLKNGSQKINDKIYINPFSFKFFEKNPLNLEKRTYPIDFGYKDAYIYSVQIEIPEGFKVSALPESRHIQVDGKAANLSFSTRQSSERIINVNCRIRFSHAAYPAEYYEGLKKFFDNILEVQNLSLIVIEENS